MVQYGEDARLFDEPVDFPCEFGIEFMEGAFIVSEPNAIFDIASSGGSGPTCAMPSASEVQVSIPEELILEIRWQVPDGWTVSNCDGNENRAPAEDP